MGTLAQRSGRRLLLGGCGGRGRGRPPCNPLQHTGAARRAVLLLVAAWGQQPSGAAPTRDDGGGSGCRMGSCGAHGVCLQGICTCVDGYTGAGCTVPPDRCQYPVAVRCSGARSHCVDGECRRPDPCAGVSCGVHGRCADGVCVCEPGFSGDGCRLDACAEVVCRNGGTCYQPSDVKQGAGPTHASLATEWSGSMLRGEGVCACATGYAGKECECMDCGRHGTCQDDGRCTCNPGFVGLRCEIDVNECASSPCKHGGRCVDGAAAYTCACSTGFLGAHCEVDVDECASAPCQNGGVCTNGAGFYSCNCTGGWSGGNCTRQPACLSSPCQNGGVCADRMEGVEPIFTCSCNVGWRGVVCEHHICDAAGTPSPCENGGLCIPVNASSPMAASTHGAAVGAAAEANVGQRRRAAARLVGQANVGFVCNCTSEWGGARCTNAPQPCNYPSVDDCEAVAWLLKGGCGQHGEYVGGEAEGRRRCAKKIRKILSGLPKLDRPCRASPNPAAYTGYHIAASGSGGYDSMLDLLLMDIEDWITDACINAEPEQSLRFGQSSEDVKKPPIDGKPPVVSGAIAAASEASYKATVSSTGSSDTTGARRTTAGRKEL